LSKSPTAELNSSRSAFELIANIVMPLLIQVKLAVLFVPVINGPVKQIFLLDKSFVESHILRFGPAVVVVGNNVVVVVLVVDVVAFFRKK
jgi:hypothetical protein